VLPDIPTVAELGLAGFDATTWHGLVAPAGTPPEVIAALHGATAAALADPGVRRALGELGSTSRAPRRRNLPPTSNPNPQWRAVVTAAGARSTDAHDRYRRVRAQSRRLAHLDVPGAGQVTIAGNHAYVGHIPNQDQLGTTIIDIADPYHPRVVATVTLDDPTSHSHKVRVVGDVMIVNHERNPSKVGRRAEQLPAARAELAAALGASRPPPKSPRAQHQRGGSARARSRPHAEI